MAFSEATKRLRHALIGACRQSSVSLLNSLTTVWQREHT